MEENAQIYITLAEYFFLFLKGIAWPVVVGLAIFVFRRPLSEFFKRVTKLDVSYGEASGGLTAEHAEKNEETAPVASKSDVRVASEEDKSEEKQIEKQENEDWFIKMHKAFGEKDFESAARIYEEGKNPEESIFEKIRNESTYLYFRYSRAGDGSALSRLRDLVETSETDEQKESPLFWLSTCYKESKNYLDAINLWVSAIDRATDESRKTEFIRNLAYAYQSNNELDNAFALLEKRLKEKRPNEEKILLYKAISDIENERGNNLSAALAMEKVIEFDPDDKDLLFGAAYLQDNADLTFLAINNYDTLISLDAGQDMALNNLGASLDGIELKIKAREFFNRACNKGNTLAMANLAQRYLKEGFVEEAGKLIADALKSDSPHENVSRVLSRINDKKEKEAKNWETVLSKALGFRNFMRAYASAYFDEHATAGDFSGTWITGDAVSVYFEVQDNILEAKWNSKIGGLLKTKFHCSLNGIIRNSSAILRYNRSPDSGQRSGSILGAPTSTSYDCYAYISVNNQEMHIFSRDPSKEFNLEFKKQ